MVNAHLDVLELELRKLDGVRTVGFSSQHDVLYIQLFVESHASTATLPFEATRIAQRHSSSPVAVELVRWVDTTTPREELEHPGLAPFFAGSPDPNQRVEASRAGSIGGPSIPAHQVEYDDTHDIRDEPSDYEDVSYPEVFDEDIDEDIEHEIDLAHAEVDEALDHDVDLLTEEYPETHTTEQSRNRIILLTVSTSSENDEIEVHLAYDEMRTIGRAPTNRGLLGAIDATVQAISELTGDVQFHAEWARSLEPGAEHASLVAVGLTNDEGTDTRHGIAGGSSPIDAAARATLNALNRVTASTPQ